MSRRRPAPADPAERDRIEQGRPRPTYYCRTCSTTAPASTPRCPPRGWLMLTAVRRKASNDPRARYARLGVFCGVGCLTAALPHITDVQTGRGQPAAAEQEGSTDG